MLLLFVALANQVPTPSKANLLVEKDLSFVGYPLASATKGCQRRLQYARQLVFSSIHWPVCELIRQDA